MGETNRGGGEGESACEYCDGEGGSHGDGLGYRRLEAFKVNQRELRIKLLIFIPI